MLCRAEFYTKRINNTLWAECILSMSLRKVAKSNYWLRHVPLSVSPSVCMEQLDSQLKDFNENLYSRILENLS